MKYKPITELAGVIRSKNAGPFELTFDIIFNDFTQYEYVKNTGVINRQLISKLYKIPESEIVSFVEYDPAKAIKITIVRPKPAGSTGETDVYGSQQHAPLLGIKIPWED